jgi:chemotaxis protein methyltransferase CheR
MNDDDLNFVRTFLKQRTGIVITPEKRYLVETRLDPIVRAQKLGSLQGLITRLRGGDKQLETDVIDAITTNETLFFRDKSPFDSFRNLILPALLKARRTTGRLRIWCAACSSGQEPYSLAMILHDMRNEIRGIEIEILATDISERMLAQAKSGTFSQFEVQRGMPIKMLLEHFTQEGLKWRIKPELARNITFRSLNLTEPFRHLGTFDLIMCRNVLIYFSEETKRDIMARLGEMLAPDGYLMLGGAETVLGLSQQLAPHKQDRSVYVKAGSPDAQAVSFLRNQAAVVTRA